jgi:hypothetical protein
LTKDVASHEKLYQTLSKCQIDHIRLKNVGIATCNLTYQTDDQKELLGRAGLTMTRNNGVTPIKAVKDGARSLVVLYHESWPSDYSISVYDGILFITISLGNKFASFEDLDHDGHFEILAQGYLTKVDGRVIEAK